MKAKSKEELADIIKKMIIQEPALKRVVKITVQNLKERIENLEIMDEEDIDSFVDEVDQSYEECIRSDNVVDHLVALFKKCFSFYSEYGAVLSH